MRFGHPVNSIQTLKTNYCPVTPYQPVFSQEFVKVWLILVNGVK